MRIFVIKNFGKWARKERVDSEKLIEMAEEVAEGQYEASLGGHLFKKRIARKGAGKSGGYRTILAYKQEDRIFFVYGFAKNEKDNISQEDLGDLKLIGASLLNSSDEEIEVMLDDGFLIEL